ncbi:MAG: carbon-nitrogen hydrolase [Elusimicrobia bacterium]|nr:carbon-nitrogen hydrolase [Elusimicrobiota bacterium]
MKRATLSIGLIQLKPTEDPRKNLAHSLRLASAAAGRGAKIICFPELYRSRYFPQKDKARARHLAETIPGESTRAFSRLAAERDVAVIVPLFERAGERFFNSAAVIDAGGKLLGTYRKVHVPHDPLFYEKSYFAPGDLGFKVFRTRYARVSALICYDQWFPEAARASVLAGAEILFYPTAIGAIRGYKPPEGDWREAWVTIQRGHAIANGVHVAAVNRTGVEGRLRFFGTSFVADAFGNVVKRASTGREEVLVVPVDLSMNREIRDGWGFLRNRRPRCYRPLVA